MRQHIRETNGFFVPCENIGLYKQFWISEPQLFLSGSNQYVTKMWRIVLPIVDWDRYELNV